MATNSTKRSRRAQAAPLPKTGTGAAERYFAVYTDVNRFLNWLLHLSSYAEHVRKTASDVLVKTSHSEAEKRKLRKEAQSPGPLDELKRQRQLLIEIVLVRHTEAYLNYLADLLFEIFTQRPETLRSSDRVEVARVLQHTSIRELVHELAQRKIDSLSYSSFSDLAGFFIDRFGLEIAPAQSRKIIVEAVETRNISVHNRCIINERYIARTKGDPKQLRKPKKLGIEDLELVVPILLKSVRVLDRSARKKLKLRGVRFNSRPTGQS